MTVFDLRYIITAIGATRADGSYYMHLWVRKGVRRLKSSEMKRASGIDLIKSMAIFFVVCVHFFLNTKYYTTPVDGLNMYVQTAVRWVFVICVPLFILSTGYLNHDKTAGKSYYFKLARIIIPYLVISILCLIVREYKNPNQFSLKNDIFSVFNFTADPYAWYVNMIIGLYLIAPFLNILLNRLDKKSFLTLIGILVFLVSLPLTFNPIFAGSSKFAFFYFPDFWSGVYPVIYYAVGVYIARFKPEFSKTGCLATALALVLLQTLLLILAQPYLKTNWFLTDYGSLFVIIESACIFLVFYNADIKSRPIRRILTVISSATLEIYLFSYIADSNFYPWIYKLSGGITQEMFFNKYFLLAVPAVFFASLVPAVILHAAYDQVNRAIKKQRSKSKKIPEKISSLSK